MQTPAWIVVRAKPGRVSWAIENVRKQNGTAYVPMTQGKRNGLACAVPLFGTYFFVQTPGPWRFLLATFGVAGVPLFCEQPAKVPHDVIELLKAREIDGLVVLPPAPEQLGRWRPGEKLRVKGGVFSGNFGIYQGLASRERERVLLDFLGRKTSVLLASELLEAA